MARVEIKRKSAEEATASGTIETGDRIQIRMRDDADRAWRYIADEDALPTQGAIIVSLARLPDAINQTGFEALGVRLSPGEDARKLKPFLGQIGMIELAFPSFRDGRNYSSARILREDLRYTGELKAVGDVLADQLHFMVRCGIDCLELHPGVQLETAERALARYKHVYQKASDGRRRVADIRNG